MTAIHSDSDIQRLESNGQQELARILEKERPRLKRMVRARLGRELNARLDASDLIQETFIQANQSLPRFLANPSVSPFLWLRTVAREVVLRQRRKHLGAEMRDAGREQREDPNNASRLLVEQVSESMLSPRSQVAHAESNQLIRQTIESMSENDRQILTLRLVEDLTLREAAVELELNLETVRRRFGRAMIRLRKACKEFEGESA